ncbi:MAG: succinate dehydrogenase subunit [Chloroflexi bacterium]|nr:succinate dehydrogenase subunit [Chloroflexota bacterium]
MIHEWDVLVVGGGIAGQIAALEAARLGKKVAILSKVEPWHTHSRNPRSVNLSVAKGDDWRKQIDDAWDDSHFLADWEPMEVVATEGPELVLHEFGDILDRDEAGDIAAYSFAGTNRAIMAGQHSGLNFMRKMFAELEERGVPFMTDRTVTSLVMEGGRCVGVTALDLMGGQVEGHSAANVVLCTGGHGFLWQNSVHGIENSGDGQALAFRAGASLRDMEFTYYHQGYLYQTPHIITEGAFHRGLHLYNKDGERFLFNYEPEGESGKMYYTKRFMTLELEAGRGIENKFFWADFTHLDESEIDEVFPRARKDCLDSLGLDIVHDRVPMAPGVQATMGGIRIDLQGRTGITGLLAAGECANTGQHGADWRVGNFMLAALIFGSHAGKTAAAETGGPAPAAREAAVIGAVHDETNRLAGIASRTGGRAFHLLRGELRRTMTEHVSVMRDADKLTRALDTVQRLKTQYETASLVLGGTRFNHQLAEFLGLGNMLTVGEAVIVAALARTETRGNHWRRDFPQRDDVRWGVHGIVFDTPDGPEIRHEPVKPGELKPREKAGMI